jgi:hypothetical protein
MSDLNDLSDLLPQEDPDFKPWEQRPASGMGSGGVSSPPDAPSEPFPERVLQDMDEYQMEGLIEQQTDLAHYPMVDRHTTPAGDLHFEAGSNEQVWQQFVREALYDTRRAHLEHFHLFEWFPLAPGKFHTPEAQFNRQAAQEMMIRLPDGRAYYNPLGKASMVRGGIGAVRLRPRMIQDEPHYFMCVSSNGVCHEGFPVLVPRRFYGPLKARLLAEGAVPVTLSGEMRYLMDDAPTFFGGRREIPQLYLHVDELHILAAPRSEVSTYTVSVAVSFVGRFQDREGLYLTYATFDPAVADSLARACQWIEGFYVTGQYRGVVVTDFDEVLPRFSNAVFGLPDLMAGKLDDQGVRAFLEEHNLNPQAGQPFFLVYREINTQGGAYIEGDVNLGGGDFIDRDQADG